MIKTITSEEANSIIETREPLGQYIYHDKEANVIIAIDNCTGDAWTEEFKTKGAARYWLRND